MKPSIGRIVHFVPDQEGGRHQAALIVNVNTDGTVNLRLWNESGSPNTAASVKFDETGAGKHTWHWPEREPDAA